MAASRRSCEARITGENSALQRPERKEGNAYVLDSLEYGVKAERRDPVEEESQQEGLVDGGKAGRESGSGDENHGEYIVVNAKLEPGKL